MTFIYPKNLSTPDVTAFFTERDVSISHENILNLSKFKQIYMPVQKHTDRVKLLLSLDDLKTSAVADAVVTNLPGVLIGIKTADCVPILLSTTMGSPVAAVHAGWRGTAMGILKKTIATMINRFSVSADDILIAIGPSIRACCYEVGQEVAEKISLVAESGEYIIKTKDKLFVDLARANIAQALLMGVPEKNIWDSGECTCCQQHRFYSYRASKTDGRQGGFIGIKTKAEDI